jgi:hypothetical protein
VNKFAVYRRNVRFKGENEVISGAAEPKGAAGFA